MLFGIKEEIKCLLRNFSVKANSYDFQVMFHNGMSNNDKDFEMCFRVDNVILPKTGYFGVSAATGGLAGKAVLSEGFLGIELIQIVYKMMEILCFVNP